MATGNLKNFSGKIANVVGYELLGKQRIRVAPGKIRQTRDTKKSASLFGKASSMAGSLRHKLVKVIPYPSDNNMHTRLNAAILKWLRDNGTGVPDMGDHLMFVEGFQFTEEGYTLAQRFRAPLAVSKPSDGVVQIDIPAFVPSELIYAPKGTASVVCDIVAVNCLIEKTDVVQSDTEQLSFDYNKNSVDAQSISLNLPTPPGSLLITAVSLKYMIPVYGGVKVSTAKGYQPAAIVSAMSL
jgi:hypothetical protein